MKPAIRILFLTLVLACSDSKPAEDPFLGLWELVALEYRLEDETLDLDAFANYVGEYDDYYSVEDVKSCYLGFRIQFEQKTFRFYKSNDNRYCREEIDDDEGTYSYSENSNDVISGQLFSDQSDTEIQRIEIQNNKLRLIPAEEDIQEGPVVVLIFEKRILSV